MKKEWRMDAAHVQPSGRRHDLSSTSTNTWRVKPRLAVTIEGLRHIQY